jgi:hypothetical protein
MSRKIFLNVILVLLLNISWLLALDTISIEKFDLMSNADKVSFINSLNKKEKINFMVKYLPDHLFAVYPVSLVKFFSDGEFIFDCEAEGGGMIGGDGKSKPYKYYIGKWYVKGENIIIENSNPIINIFGKYSVINNLIVEEDTLQNSIQYQLQILEGINREGKNVKNDEANIWDGTPDLKSRGLSPAIDSYTKLKQVKKKIVVK